MAKRAKKRKIRIRKRWRINPRTRVECSSKRYKRTKADSNFKKTLESED